VRCGDAEKKQKRVGQIEDINTSISGEISSHTIQPAQEREYANEMGDK
jgi:hypothetical protein